ncbi:MAG: GGDEF domain-containing protein [Smithellaceae bacterium]
MVKEAEPVSVLRAVLAENPEIVTDYLMAGGRLAILLVDRQGSILDCNPFFLENAGLAEKPIGQSVDIFLTESLPTAQEGEPQICRNVRLTFILNHSLEHTLSGHMMDIGNRRLIVAHSIRLTDNEMVTKMSRFNDELTDLTRALNKKNRELAAANEKITQLMNTDPLTGLSNRRQLLEHLDVEISKARRHGSALSAVMMDIDHFKSINDTFGHDGGDRVLAGIAQAMRSMCRKEDIIARFGGEEFILLLPGSPASSALECAERIRKAIQDKAFEGIPRQVTASFGVSLFSKDDTQDSLLKRADNALYLAKTSGRNRIELNEDR